MDGYLYINMYLKNPYINKDIIILDDEFIE